MELFVLLAGLVALIILLGATGIIGDDLLAPILDRLLGTGGGSAVTIYAHLFKSNTTPAVTDTLSTYTVADFTGHAGVALSGWSAASVASHVGSTTASNATFTITSGSQDVYGVVFTDNVVYASSTKFYGAVRDPSAPVTLDASNTNAYIIATSLTDQSA